MECYLDNAATSRVYEEVVELCCKLFREDYGNPSSLHMKGVEAEKYLKAAKDELAKALKCDAKEVVFTSGGTESNNLAVIGTAFANKRRGKHIITTKIEHASILSPMKFLEHEGFEVTYLGTNEDGIVTVDTLKEALREDTILVSIMMVNNEIGAIEPIEELCKATKEFSKDIIFHTDAIQGFGKIRFSVKSLGVDLLSLSGHKIHAPKGTGALYVKDKTHIVPIIYGGGQQLDRRSGTENVPGYAGLGLATKILYENFDKNMEYVKGLKDLFISEVTKFENVQNNSKGAPYIASISFIGVRAEVMLHALEDKGVYVSAGSACSSNKPHVSNVLTEIQLSKEALESTLRFSFCEENTEEEVMYAVKVIGELLPMLRRYVRK